MSQPTPELSDNVISLSSSSLNNSSAFTLPSFQSAGFQIWCCFQFNYSYLTCIIDLATYIVGAV
jgi:hypothetical protein